MFYSPPPLCYNRGGGFFYASDSDGGIHTESDDRWYSRPSICMFVYVGRKVCVQQNKECFFAEDLQDVLIMCQPEMEQDRVLEFPGSGGWLYYSAEKRRSLQKIGEITISPPTPRRGKKEDDVQKGSKTIPAVGKTGGGRREEEDSVGNMGSLASSEERRRRRRKECDEVFRAGGETPKRERRGRERERESCCVVDFLINASHHFPARGEHPK